MHNVTLSARSCNHCCSGKALHILSVCQPELSSTKYARAVLYCHPWPLWLCNIYFTLSQKRHHFREKVIGDKICGLIFSTIFVWTFLILRRIQRDIIRMYVGIHIKYPLLLSEFNEIWIFSTDVLKILNNQISRRSVQWEPRGWTDRYGEANSSFSQFCGSAYNSAYFKLILFTCLDRVWFSE